MTIRNVAFVTFPGVLALDVAGPAEVLSMATRILGKGQGLQNRLLVTKWRLGRMHIRDFLQDLLTRRVAS